MRRNYPYFSSTLAVVVRRPHTVNNSLSCRVGSVSKLFFQLKEITISVACQNTCRLCVDLRVGSVSTNASVVCWPTRR